MLLDQKVAIVYGAGAIGGAVAKAFAREGAAVFLASRTAANAQSIADAIGDTSGTVRAAGLDVLDEDAVEQHVADVAATAGRIDVLFNAIGMDDVQGTALLDMPFDDLAQPVVKAVKSQFITARAVGRRMAVQRGGVIQTITVAPSPVPYHGGFGVACGALESLWRHFAAELGPQGVRFVVIRSAGSPDAPDIRATFERHAAAAGITPEEFTQTAGDVTLLRRLPLLAEVADAAAILASDRASAMTAAMANVTCGYWVDV